MPRFYIRSRFNATNISNDRPGKKSHSVSASGSPPSVNAPSTLPVQHDTLPTRQSNGHALHYHSYAPSRYYTSIPHRTLRRPRRSAATVVAPKPRENLAHLHLQFDSPDNTSQTISNTSLAPANSSNNSTSSLSTFKSDSLRGKQETQNHSVQHAIRLKATALRQYLAGAAELGNLSVLKQVVASHRDSLARARKARHAALVRLHDATTLTGLPPPATTVAPPMHGTYRPTPIRALPTTTTHHHHHHHHIRSLPVPTPHQYYSRYQKQQQKNKDELAPPEVSEVRNDAADTEKTTLQKYPEQQQKKTVRRVQGTPGKRSPRIRSNYRGRRAASTKDGRSVDSSRPASSTCPPSTAAPSEPASSLQKRSEGLKGTASGSEGRKRYVTILSRKSTGTLRRLGSAGSMFIKRFSRGSVGDDPSSVPTASNKGDGNSTGAGVLDKFEESMVTAVEVSAAVAAATGVVSSTLGKATLERLRTEPVEVVAELEAECRRLQIEERDLLVQLKGAERLLDQRRDMHDKAMEILDQFYGSLPGWQQDPITQTMFVETVDMTDAGLETERDLAEARHNMWQAFAALKDHELGLSALQSVGEQLGLFISGLERLLRSTADYNNVYEVDIYSTIRQLEKHLTTCVSKGQMAAECCVESSRVSQIERDLKSLKEGFGKEVLVLVNEKNIREVNMNESLRVAKATVCECKLAEKYVQERLKMIGEDMESFEESAEICEEYVIMERMALVDLHHPARQLDEETV